MGSPSRTSYPGNMLSLKLGLFVCIFFVIDMEAAPERKPEDLHIHLNFHDPTGAAKEGGGVAQEAGDHGPDIWDNGNVYEVDFESSRNQKKKKKKKGNKGGKGGKGGKKGNACRKHFKLVTDRIGVCCCKEYKDCCHEVGKPDIIIDAW